MVHLNVIALMQLTHCFLNTMIEQGHGKILNMSSVAAFSAGPYMSIYYATKAEDVAKGGIRAMMRGKTLSYFGSYTKCMSLLCRIVPRSVARKYAAGMNQ